MSLQNLCWLIFIDCFWCYRGSGTYPLCTGDPHNPWADPMNQPIVQLPGVWWEAHQLSACTGTAKVGNVSLGQSYCAWTGGATGAVWLWQIEEFETLHVECMSSSCWMHGIDPGKLSAVLLVFPAAPIWVVFKQRVSAPTTFFVLLNPLDPSQPVGYAMCLWQNEAAFGWYVVVLHLWRLLYEDLYTYSQYTPITSLVLLEHIRSSMENL